MKGIIVISGISDIFLAKRGKGKQRGVIAGKPAEYSGNLQLLED